MNERQSPLFGHAWLPQAPKMSKLIVVSEIHLLCYYVAFCVLKFMCKVRICIIKMGKQLVDTN